MQISVQMKRAGLLLFAVLLLAPQLRANVEQVNLKVEGMT